MTNRITPAQREAIVLRAIAERDALLTPPPSPTAAEQAQPVNGWKLVPIEPTIEMQSAGARSIIDGQDNRPSTSWAEEAAMAYCAMLSVAPVPEQAQPAGVTEDARDAARYRWIEQHASVIFDEVQSWSLETGKTIYSAQPASRELGVAIDAARAQEGE